MLEKYTNLIDNNNVRHESNALALGDVHDGDTGYLANAALEVSIARGDNVALVL